MTILKQFILSCILILPLIASDTTTPPTKTLAVFYNIKGDIQKKYNNFAEKRLKTIGFNLSNEHKRVNDQYEAKYGSTILDVLSFMPIVNDKEILPLLNIDPRIAGFAPFNFLIHKKLDENTTHIGHLQPKVMLDILGIKNKEVRDRFTNTFTSLDKMVEKEIGGDKTYTSYKKLPKHTMINFEYKFKAVEDIDDFIDEFQNKFEMAFINKKYLIAGYHNFMDSTDDAEDILKDYDAFWTYSLCHLEFSYGMFDNKGARPEAGLFAPCTMYMYIKKGTNTLVVGMFRLHNWSDTLNITDPKRLALIKKLDIEIPQILKDFGMVDLDSKKEPTLIVKKIKKDKKIVLKTKTSRYKVLTPIKPIQPPKVIELDGTTNSNKGIVFSKRCPPDYIPHGFGKDKVKDHKNIRIGEASSGQISTYLRGEYLTTKDVIERLKKGGFEIVTSLTLDKKGTLTSVVFTSKELKAMGDKDNSGFISSLRVLIDKKKKKISITNPIYMAKGFLQNSFDEKSIKIVLNNIINNFPNLKNSKDKLKYQLLPKYTYMKGMAKYNDMIEISSGTKLMDKLKKNKRIAFVLKISKTRTLVGVKLRRRTKKFIKRIGRKNAGLLPYPVLIENNKAKILDPKFYIAYMYPLLKMTQFMTIATTPDEMIKDCKRAFR